MRVGLGYDVHRLAKGRKLILGGVEIPFEKGLLGHSDADVLTHAMCDALLGAAALGDIGTHFPDSDPRYKDIYSIELLRMTVERIKSGNLSIVNLDATVFAQRPKIAPHVEAMKNCLAHAVDFSPTRINIKATTTEGLGMIGSGEGIAAMCIALLE